MYLDRIEVFRVALIPGLYRRCVRIEVWRIGMVSVWHWYAMGMRTVFPGICILLVCY